MTDLSLSIVADYSVLGNEGQPLFDLLIVTQVPYC